MLFPKKNFIKNIFHCVGLASLLGSVGAPCVATADSFEPTTPTRYPWLDVSASALYIFNSADNLHGHSGWGGVLDFSTTGMDFGAGWYGKAGIDFVYYQTKADITRSGLDFREEAQAYQFHCNFGGGYRFSNFDLSVLGGLGLGAMHTDGTTYNYEGSETSFDATLQLVARLTWRPTDNVSVFAGYRMLWNVPFEGDDCWCDDYYYNGCGHCWGNCYCDEDEKDYPRMLAHAIEVGVTITF